MRKFSVLLMMLLLLAISMVSAISLQEIENDPTRYVQVHDDEAFASYVDAKNTKVIKHDFPYLVIKTNSMIVHKKAEKIVYAPNAVYFYDLKDDSIVRAIEEIREGYSYDGKLTNKTIKPINTEYKPYTVGYLMADYVFIIATGQYYKDVVLVNKAY